MTERRKSKERGQILIVDDEPDVLASLRRQLRREFDVYTAQGADQALAILGKRNIQVIVSDQRMPGVTGIELLARARREYPNATRLLLTAYADLQGVIEAINSGQVYRYITKPWDPDEIRMAIGDALERSWLMDENQRLLVDLTRANAELEIRIAERTAVLAESERRYRTIVDGTTNPVILTDAWGTITAVNPAFTRVTGYSKAESIGRNASILSSGRHRPDFFHEMWRSLAETHHWSGIIWNRRKDGRFFIQHVHITRVRDQADAPCQFVGIYTEPAEATNILERVWIDAQHDPLTGLPNRVLLHDRLESGLIQAQRDHGLLSVLFLDLDGFKPVNDRFGHAVGDEVLEVIAGRLRAAVRQTDTVARMGGDEFVVLLPGIHSGAQAQRISEKLDAAISVPVPTSAGSVRIGVSIGLVLFPEDASEPAELLKLADARMYARKAERQLSSAGG